MIRAGADVNEAQLDGTRPVHWAVYRVDHDLMAELIAKKAKVDVANEFGYTPLSEAVKQGDARMVKMLMDAGSGTEGANADGQTALMIAIKNGDLAVFQMLIDAGAKVNVVEKVQDQTPLMWAAAATRNAAEMVRVLIAKGATVNARARFNDWPSQITSEPRAQYHAYGGLTPLLYAARSGCLACAEALVSAGADVNLPTPEGATPMMIALDNNNNDVAKFFLEHGGNPHLWDVYGRTALYIAVDHAAGGGSPSRWRRRWWWRRRRRRAWWRSPGRCRSCSSCGSHCRASPGSCASSVNLARLLRVVEAVVVGVVGGGAQAGRGGGGGGRGGDAAGGRAWWWLYGFEHRDHQPLACSRCGSESATQYASSQQSGRTLQRSAPQLGNNAAAARTGRRQHGSRSTAGAEGCQPEHLCHGALAVPVCRRHNECDL